MTLLIENYNNILFNILYKEEFYNILNMLRFINYSQIKIYKIRKYLYAYFILVVKTTWTPSLYILNTYT